MMRNGLDDKLLLVCVLILLIATMFALSAYSSKEGVAWAQQAATGVLGALIAIVTGGAKISSGNNSVIATNTEQAPEKVEHPSDK
jgi:type II secretory pathway pseudopilin PulG